MGARAVVDGVPVSVAFRPRVSRAYFALIATSLMIGALFWQCGLTLRFEDAEPVVIAFVFLILTGHLLQVRSLHRLGSMLELVPLFLMVSLSFTLVGIGIAASHMPLQDAKLAHADQVLFPFLDWSDVVLKLASRDSWASAIANFAYSSMGWQVLSILLLGSVTGNRAACERFLTTWITALSLTMAIHAFWPAAGAFHYYSIPHATVPAIHANVGWRQPQIIHDLRDGVIKTVDWGTLEGLISFPSFHAAAAVILARSYRIYKPLKWPALVLNIVMIFAAVPCGGHYFVDIVAGLWVATVTLMIIERDDFGTAEGRWRVNLRPRMLVALNAHAHASWGVARRRGEDWKVKDSFRKSGSGG